MDSASDSMPAAVPDMRLGTLHIHININLSSAVGFQRMWDLLLECLPAPPSAAQATVSEAFVVLTTAPAQPSQPPAAAEGTRFCSICRGYGSNSELPCGHAFHNDCIMPWVTRHNRCGDGFCTVNVTPQQIRPL